VKASVYAPLFMSQVSVRFGTTAGPSVVLGVAPHPVAA
jgi:hypothetical protein